MKTSSRRFCEWELGILIPRTCNNAFSGENAENAEVEWIFLELVVSYDPGLSQKLCFCAGFSFFGSEDDDQSGGDCLKHYLKLRN